MADAGPSSVRRSKVTLNLDVGSQAGFFGVAQVEGRLLADEQLGVLAALTGADFDGDFHVDLLMVETILYRRMPICQSMPKPAHARRHLAAGLNCLGALL